MPMTVAGALAWPGVATRWRRFIEWWKSSTIGLNGNEQTSRAENTSDNVRTGKDLQFSGPAFDALAGFARAVGRIRTFRALALDDAGLARILHEDEIFPSGRLQSGVSAQSL